MKKLLLIAVICAFCNIAFAQGGNCGQAVAPVCTDDETIAVSGHSITFGTNGGQNVSIEEVIAGAPSTVSIVTQACGHAGTCSTVDTYTTVANVIRSITLPAAPDYITITASWTGGAGVSVRAVTKISTAAPAIAPGAAAITALSTSTKAALTTAVVVKASSGNLYGAYALNGAASTCWLQFLNASASPALGTSVILAVPLPASATQPVYIVPTEIALANFTTGISVGIATTAAGSTACGTGGNVVIEYE